MKRPTLPTANLDLLERLYKWGVIWIVLYIVFFAVHSNVNYLFCGYGGAAGHFY